MKVKKNSAQKIAFKSEASKQAFYFRKAIFLTGDGNGSNRKAPYQRGEPSSKRRTNKLRCDVWEKKSPGNDSGDAEGDSHARVEFNDANDAISQVFFRAVDLDRDISLFAGILNH